MDLYNFTELKLLVERIFSIDVDSYNSKFEPPPKIRIEISDYELDEKIEINDDGIFYIDDDKKIKGFLYIPIYDPEEWAAKGWNTMPRFHIINCKIIRKQRNRSNFDGHYVFSNEPVTDLEDIDGIEKDLIICGYCKRELGIPFSINSTEYCEDYLDQTEFNEDDLPKEISVNDFGYTPDWDEKSKAYRISCEFTCENCGIKLNENYHDGYYLETHHINGNKTDNDERNLKCLCTLCHAYFDKNHLQNYSHSKNFIKLKEFVETFYHKLVAVKNPYLGSYLKEFGSSHKP